ncbi:uncharacterized protein ACA1_224880 [Acanthamoeba castellanii str. Neff]|uniref:Uncharacterized protein n=1 Tax=Acanthamoeba castellanii (strain ATCC 30010 / Neff) TaxID=1257118 RepID=L8GT71_ACACF|nr:uncharacterized protein ACA1_224880 [Acanthamoeba castellanii str. Neff]ELR16087.1 hypothetical protein ACA1_224880 [Acanthamoeba castellanii str. Neff]
MPLLSHVNNPTAVVALEEFIKGYLNDQHQYLHGHNTIQIKSLNGTAAKRCDSFKNTPQYKLWHKQLKRNALNETAYQKHKVMYKKPVVSVGWVECKICTHAVGSLTCDQLKLYLKHHKIKIKPSKHADLLKQAKDHVLG